MKPVIFTGAAVALVTPFNADGSVNYEELARLIDFQIENGTDALVIAGTTGESSTLSEQEHIDVINRQQLDRDRCNALKGSRGSRCRCAPACHTVL